MPCFRCVRNALHSCGTENTLNNLWCNTTTQPDIPVPGTYNQYLLATMIRAISCSSTCRLGLAPIPVSFRQLTIASVLPYDRGSSEISCRCTDSSRSYRPCAWPCFAATCRTTRMPTRNHRCRVNTSLRIRRRQSSSGSKRPMLGTPKPRELLQASFISCVIRAICC